MGEWSHLEQSSGDQVVFICKFKCNIGRTICTFAFNLHWDRKPKQSKVKKTHNVIQCTPDIVATFIVAIRT